MSDRAGMIAIIMVVALSLAMFFIGLVIGQNTNAEKETVHVADPAIQANVNLCFQLLTNSVSDLNKSVEEVRQHQQQEEEPPAPIDYSDRFAKIEHNDANIRRLIADLKSVVVNRCK